jgi:Zn-dependent alcohol dehydrogenase
MEVAMEVRAARRAVRAGRFPFDRVVKYYEMAEVERALADSKSGEVIKPVLRMPRPSHSPDWVDVVSGT